MFGKKKIEAVSVLDLRNYTPQALRKISSIQAVSTILLPENPSPAFAEAYADITKGAIAARAVCVAIPEDFDLPDRADPITMVEWAQVLGMLGREDQILLAMRRQGYGSKEIGLALGISGSAVRTRLQKVRKLLRKVLAD